MPYTQLYYHIIWTTKNREPVLIPEVEPLIYGVLRSKAEGLGAIVFALNGWYDHVHMVATIPAKLAVATFIGQVKAVATARFNKSGHQQAPIYWQSEYAIFSIDKKRLPYHIAYVDKQKQHHASGELIPILERIQESDSKEIQESQADYRTLYPDGDWIPE